MARAGTVSKKKRNSNWGGKRPNAGRPPSEILKKKISVLVTTDVWEVALELWDGRASQLINHLIDEYIDENTGQQD